MVRRLFVLLGLGLTLLPLFGGCGVNEEGGLAPDSGVGGSGLDGGGGVGGGQCFPGSKVCPDPAKPSELLCLTADDPEYGCSQSTSCAPCNLPHATAKCGSGACAIDACNPGWDDCNNNPVDGCETDLTGDKNHCGTCANDCVATKGAGWICNQGKCEVNECCPTGDPSCQSARDCDGNKGNGCEVNVSNDPANCKTCGNACALQHATSACSQEVCVITKCDSGWGNCDKNDATGCEINTNQGDKANCGTCGKVCNETHAGATCVGSTCQLACHPGWGNCDLNPDNGCETDLKTALNCNACNKPCNPANVATALCNNGACDYDTCLAGYADCDNNRANGCEVNILQNVNHCSGCGKKCTAPSGGSVVCSNGACAESCGTGLTNCSGVCVPLGSDINNCGACGKQCGAPANGNPTCNGTCGFNCQNGFHKCNGTECRANNDATACGSTCQNCPGPTSGSGNAVCTGGNCGIVCTTPTTGKCGTDCYNLNADKNHCGTCTTVCTDPANGTNTCGSGTCTVSCNTGFHVCSGQCRSNNDVGSCGTTSCSPCPGPTAGTGSATCNGTACGLSCAAPTPDLCGTACVNKQTSTQHCVSCGTQCTAGQTCCGTGTGCVDLQTDKNNCNSCGNPCPGQQTCVAGACTGGGGTGGTGGTGGSGGSGGT